jgi:uncharacterized protein (TIRG00374 family)
LSKKPSSNANRYWKLIPGLLISAFFLWRTLRGFHLDELRDVSFGHPVWILGVLLFISCDYGLRSYRWWLMLRRYNARFTACFRVLLTSLAANNILPFRIGDFLRVFAYAPDVNAASSAVLSTVVLERLLDTVMLLGFFAVAVSGLESRFSALSFHGHGIADTVRLALIFAALCLCLLLFGTHLLHLIVQKLVARFGNHPRTRKFGEWAETLFDAVLHIPFPVRFLLLLLTALVWFFEGLVFYSAAQILGLDTFHGSMLASILSNLSFLLPSAPGGIGPFEASAKLAMESQGVATSVAILYALFVHFVVFMIVNIVGGIGFLLNRKEHGGKSLSEELETLPPEADVL